MTSSLDRLLHQGTLRPPNAAPGPEALAPLRERCAEAHLFAGALWILPHELVSATDWSELTARKVTGHIPFALDILGNVLCAHEGAIVQIDLEGAEPTLLATSLEDFAAGALASPEAWLGAHLAARWSVHYGPLPRGTRLLPTWPLGLRPRQPALTMSAQPWEEVVHRRARRGMSLPPGWRTQVK